MNRGLFSRINVSRWVHVCHTSEIFIDVYIQTYVCTYGMASVSRIDKIIGLFCKRALIKRQYSAKEIYNFVDPTDRSYLISCSLFMYTYMYISYVYICIYT